MILLMSFVNVDNHDLHLLPHCHDYPTLIPKGILVAILLL